MRGRGEKAEQVQVDVQVRHPAGRRWGSALRSVGLRFLEALQLERCELSLSIVTDAQIRRLNRVWRGKDKATDVLSFPADPLPRGTPGPRPLGDVIISLDTARRQAKEYERTLSDELTRYLAHGILHLLGHDHHRVADARKMAAAEARLLGKSGMVPAPRRRRL